MTVLRFVPLYCWGTPEMYKCPWYTPYKCVYSAKRILIRRQSVRLTFEMLQDSSKFCQPCLLKNSDSKSRTSKKIAEYRCTLLFSSVPVNGTAPPGVGILFSRTHVNVCKPFPEYLSFQPSSGYSVFCVNLPVHSPNAVCKNFCEINYYNFRYQWVCRATSSST